ncbi:DUF2062 domain-containing protein [Roseobacter sp. HKCCA0434]|uniref:DUF2062 domain-containing protein n=1 Tax=Roseobacter sp. HKCCA0434 TaxID=3079297 RepID=UPI002905CBAC|nr:DUF2062 domain-containing protein [Roseobacter sp. HKCCA0434]
MFKRRKPLGYLEWMREGVAPRAGWRRVVEYLAHRVRRLPDSPHKISLGLAIGVFMSFSPLFGLHILIAAGLAWVMRANILAAVTGTFFGNPLTFPFIVYVSLRLGRWITGTRGTSEFELLKQAVVDAWQGLWFSFKSLFGFGPAPYDRLLGFWDYFFWPYLVGGLIPGLLGAVLTYYVSRPFVRAYQARRRAQNLARIAKATEARDAKVGKAARRGGSA